MATLTSSETMMASFTASIATSAFSLRPARSRPSAAFRGGPLLAWRGEQVNGITSSLPSFVWKATAWPYPRPDVAGASAGPHASLTHSGWLAYVPI